MLISNKHKLLFIHIPKSGGTSIRQIIKQNDPKSFQYNYYHEPITEEIYNKYKNYHKFVMVRNSWEICASCYRFEKNDKPGKNFMPDLNMSFIEWIKWKSEFKKPNHYPFPRQLPFFIKDNELLVDQIMKYENFENEIKHLCEKTGMEFYDKKAHFYGNYDYKKFYNKKENYEIVKEICKEDIEYFGWEL